MPESELEPLKVKCPKGHESLVSRVQVLRKSEVIGDLGKVECPLCKTAWCCCPRHGNYPCPPPCPFPHE
jgi:hypothetical protein